MHPADIKAALQKKGQTSRSVAAYFHVRDGSVSQIIHGRAKSKRIARRISQLTGIPVSRLWPGRYPSLELVELRRAA